MYAERHRVDRFPIEEQLMAMKSAEV